MFKISRDQAREIVKSCGGRATLLTVPHLGVTPRGLIPNERWQMDVTHFPSFGRLKYVHVKVGTYSGFIHTSLLSGEASRDVITQTLQCMAAMGKPQIIKTDNGPSYTGTKFQQFCSQFDIKHVTGGPCNPQGQGIVERAHQTLCLRHPKSQDSHTLVLWKDPLTGQRKGPDPALIWGRGSACIYDKENAGRRWLSERLVKTVNPPVSRMEQLSPPEANLISFPDAAPNKETPDPVADQNDHQPSIASTQIS
jgi:transposase InsO family protein